MEEEPEKQAHGNAEPDLVHVYSKHPTYNFQVGNFSGLGFWKLRSLLVG
jgi:hypothetical protein